MMSPAIQNKIDSQIPLDTRREQISFILNLTDSMLDQAKQGNWENLSEIEIERREHLEKFFTVETSSDEVVLVRQAIEYIMNIDEKIIQIGEKSKRLLIDERNNLSKGQSASKAYSQF